MFPLFLVYQKALLTSELEEIFANAPAAPSASVQHSGLKKAWQKATGSPVKDEGPDDSGGKKRLPEEGDTCPIVSPAFRTLCPRQADHPFFVYSALTISAKTWLQSSIVKPHAAALFTKFASLNGLLRNLNLLVSTVAHLGRRLDLLEAAQQQLETVHT